MNILVTDSVAIRDAYIRNEGFAEVTSGVYQSSKDTLYFNEKITVPFIRSVFSASKKMAERIEESQWKTRSLILEESLPNISIWCLVEGRSTCTEHQEGDIVLPNTFLKYNPEVGVVDFDKSNHDSFLQDPLFLTQYEQQADVDFELFGLSIGGISITKEDWIDDISKGSVEFAYSADCIDTVTYPLVQEAIAQDCSERFYPLILILDSGTNAEKKWQIAEYIPAVITYFWGGDDTGVEEFSDENPENN